MADVCVCVFAAACCRLICHIAEVLASYQISSSEARKLFLRFQAKKVHLVSASHSHLIEDGKRASPVMTYIPLSPSFSLLLQEKLPPLLHSVAMASSHSVQPSTFVEFNYRRPAPVSPRQTAVVSASWLLLHL